MRKTGFGIRGVAPSTITLLGLAIGTKSRLTIATRALVAALALALVTGSGQEAVAAPRLASPAGEQLTRLAAQVERDGKVSVLIELRVPFHADGRLSAPARQAQRDRIASAGGAVVRALRGYGATVGHRYETIPFLAARVDAAGLRRLMALPEVAALGAPIRMRPLLRRSIPFVGADLAWEKGFAGAGQAVAVLDTGVDSTHQFMAGKVIAGLCYSGRTGQEPEMDWCPDHRQGQYPGAGEPDCDRTTFFCEHGTEVAGIAAGRADEDLIAGVARDAQIIAGQITPVYEEDVLRALEHVAKMSRRFRIAAVNMSFGWRFGAYHDYCDDDDTATRAMAAALNNLRSLEIAPVAGTGNGYHVDGIAMPACLSAAISVGATENGIDQIASFSDVAPIVSLLAPGDPVESSIPLWFQQHWGWPAYHEASGTSFSTPHVAGAFALLRSARPDATVDEILAALRSTGVPVTDHRPGGTVTIPRIRIDGALAKLLR